MPLPCHCHAAPPFCLDTQSRAALLQQAVVVEMVTHFGERPTIGKPGPQHRKLVVGKRVDHGRVRRERVCVGSVCAGCQCVMSTASLANTCSRTYAFASTLPRACAPRISRTVGIRSRTTSAPPSMGCGGGGMGRGGLM